MQDLSSLTRHQTNANDFQLLSSRPLGPGKSSLTYSLEYPPKIQEVVTSASLEVQVMEHWITVT